MIDDPDQIFLETLPDPDLIVVEVEGQQGPPGPSTGGSGGATTFLQASPSASWNISHAFGRRPVVAVYSASGEELIADVSATNTAVSVVFASPTAGSAVLA